MTDSPRALTTRHEVAAEVRAAAARHRYTQEQIGALLKLKQSAVSRRYNGHVPFDVDELEALAEAWDVPVTDFFPRPTRHPDGGLNKTASSPFRRRVSDLLLVAA